MQPALHQDPGAAERDRLINLLADFIEGPDICVGRARPPVESTEGADYVAHVGVIHVAIDDVGDNVVRVATLANLIGREPNAHEVVRFEQKSALVRRQAITCKHAVEDWLNRRSLSHFVSIIAPVFITMVIIQLLTDHFQTRPGGNDRMFVSQFVKEFQTPIQIGVKAKAYIVAQVTDELTLW